MTKYRVRAECNFCEYVDVEIEANIEALNKQEAIDKFKKNIINYVDLSKFDISIKEPLNKKGLFYGVSKILKNDKSINKLLNKKDLTKYFKGIRNGT